MAILKKITKLKNLGVYADFSWPSDLAELKKYNVIYGWNGTGKTTLSKLLGALATGSHPEFPALEYTVQDSGDGSHSQGSGFSTPIRVFNAEFIANNVDFEKQSSKTITVILGEENKEALEAIAADEKKLDEVNADITQKTTEKSGKESSRSQSFTDIARTISQGTQGAIVRNYNKTNAETAFKAMTGKELLSKEELTTMSKSVAQNPMDSQAELSLEDTADKLASVIADAKKLLSETVEAKVIERLKENADISEWVEAGLALHEHHKNKLCEFCGQPLTADRIAELTAHFNEADAKLKANVDTLVLALQHIYARISALQPTDKMNFYQELRDDYAAKTVVVTDKRDLALASITEFGELVKSKKSHTTEVLSVAGEPNLDDLASAVVAVNGIIVSHNQKTDNFTEQRKADSQKLERHYLSTIHDDVTRLDGEIKVLGDALQELKGGVEGDEANIGKVKLEARIAESKARISSSHKACKMLGDSLETFLGHNEITFSANADDTGYQILRRGHPAKSLSEGECTAIAFVFFVTQLKDDSFDTTNGIIVVDDPVSSLDANSQFQAFSFLKNATSEASQLILFTHNFDFLKLVLGWVKNSRKPFSLYMVKNKNSTTDGSRSAYLSKLDATLEKFESEYHYLFDVVYKYKDNGEIESAYKMPNIARKLLDSFLLFQVPIPGSTYERLQTVTFDETKKTAIYKFVNDQSHITGAGFDPSLVPETQKCVGYLLEFMEKTAPDHYKHLVETIAD